MAKVIGVKFKNSGKSYFFDPAGFDVHKDDHVIVETGKGIDYGTVVSDIREVEDSKIFYPLKPIMRIATQRDEEQVAANHEREKEAFQLCLDKVHEHNLDMKLTEVEYAFDNSKILFYFTSDGYVDFRELVKDLAAVFRTRIELRQIGVRDEARALGGLGACGRPMCCATYLNDFVPVSIKMAKEQNLPLNPTKISGVCGRLMCCLKNEEETYEELNKTMPDVGDFVEGEDGLQGDVFSTNVLRQTVKVLVEVNGEKEMHDYEAGQITVLRKRRGKKNNNNNDNVDEKQLAALEDKPEKSTDSNKSGKDNRKENRGNGEGRENRENRGNGEGRENRENRGNGEGRENRENNRRDRRDGGKNRGNGEGREGRDNREGRENRGRDNAGRDNNSRDNNGKDNTGRDNNGESGNNGHKNGKRFHGHHDRNKGNRNDRNNEGAPKGNGEN